MAVEGTTAPGILLELILRRVGLICVSVSNTNVSKSTQNADFEAGARYLFKLCQELIQSFSVVTIAGVLPGASMCSIPVRAGQA